MDTNKIIETINEFGACILQGNFPPEMCDRVIEQQKKITHPLVNTDGGDRRHMHFHRHCEEALWFLGNEELLDLVMRYTDSKLSMEWNDKEKMNVHKSRCQSGIVSVEDGSKSSGGGWHCDSHYRQLKAMVYLHDVDEKCGPFAILCGSRDNDVQTLDDNKYRYSDDIIRNHSLYKKKMVLTGKKGDIILFDSSNIHRGMPIDRGIRYTLTNYYYTDNMKG
tara:strand:+ start:182 stop:844 length:663 start_codon:yes stop_codon:yes gene_type:complete